MSPQILAAEIVALRNHLLWQLRTRLPAESILSIPGAVLIEARAMAQEYRLITSAPASAFSRRARGGAPMNLRDQISASIDMAQRAVELRTAGESRVPPEIFTHLMGTPKRGFSLALAHVSERLRTPVRFSMSGRMVLDRSTDEHVFETETYVSGNWINPEGQPEVITVPFRGVRAKHFERLFEGDAEEVYVFIRQASFDLYERYGTHEGVQFDLAPGGAFAEVPAIAGARPARTPVTATPAAVAIAAANYSEGFGAMAQ